MTPNSEFTLSIVKVLSVSAVTFLVALFLTPPLTRVLYRYKLWRKSVRASAPGGFGVPIFRALHAEREVRVPRAGGILVWLAVISVAALFFFASRVSESFLLDKWNFLSRNQTWLPLAILFAGSLIGLADDLLQTLGSERFGDNGLRFSRRLLLVLLVGIAGAWWFHTRLGFDAIHLPFGAYWGEAFMPLINEYGSIYVGWLAMPIFVLVLLAVFSGGVMDGLDGLAGGVFATMFGAYGLIALFQNQVDIAAFCGAVVGALLAFLWFNIPPARFYMGETGVIGLAGALTVVAFLTNSVWVLPIIGFVPASEAGSVILQLLSKKFRGGKKIFLVAPIHHHFEALGWPPYTVVMRFWLVSAVAATIGIAIRLIG